MLDRLGIATAPLATVFERAGRVDVARRPLAVVLGVVEGMFVAAVAIDMVWHGSK